MLKKIEVEIGGYDMIAVPVVVKTAHPVSGCAARAMRAMEELAEQDSIAPLFPDEGLRLITNILQALEQDAYNEGYEAGKDS